jgi:acyl-CoA synthetase (NDP forming)
METGAPWAPGGTSFITSHEQLGFSGRLYPVNPKVSEVLGYKTYPTVSSIPEPLDLVIVAVPARALPTVLEDCIQADAKNIHAFTAGFEETGEPEAVELGLKVREIADRGQLRLIGPNCMGLWRARGRIVLDQLF